MLVKGWGSFKPGKDPRKLEGQTAVLTAFEQGACKIVQGPLDSCDYVELLMEDYLSGQTRREINVFFTPANSYYRVIFFMYEDD